MGRRSKKSLRGRIIPRSKYHQPNMVVRRSMGQEGRSVLCQNRPESRLLAWITMDQENIREKT